MNPPCGPGPVPHMTTPTPVLIETPTARGPREVVWCMQYFLPKTSRRPHFPNRRAGFAWEKGNGRGKIGGGRQTLAAPRWRPKICYDGGDLKLAHEKYPKC
ncbi:MAG: hypothetical protein CM15mP55_2170 [Hyphomicrobiales bacterium]|nr:MAG: hypothetical protein CM15mP55_2170 [Hyphomicrobiales bacterium]